MAGNGSDSVPIRLNDRERLLNPDGTIYCFHSNDGRFHDHGERFDVDAARERSRAMLDELNRPN